MLYDALLVWSKRHDERLALLKDIMRICIGDFLWIEGMGYPSRGERSL